MTALLAVVSATLVGGVDFFGGLVSRALPPVRVAAAVQVAGLAVAVPLCIVVGSEEVTRGDVAWSLVSGVTVGLGLGLFYTAMARGLISLVTPLTAAVGAIVPVTWSFARGEVPGAVAVAGLVLALVAIVIVSMAPAAPGELHDGRTLLLGAGAGVLFGVFFVSYSLTGEDAGLWPVSISRVASAGVLVGAALVLTRGVALPRSSVRTLCVLGLLEVVAATLLLLALQRGPVSIASVLGSLYPVSSVLLAALLLHERLTRPQIGGVALALVAVALVSTG